MASLQEQIKALQEQNEALQAKLASKVRVTMRVSEKGALSIYGLRRFPVTFYSQEWTKILGLSDAIKAFIQEHTLELTTK
jgi:hypothetical protein